MTDSELIRQIKEGNIELYTQLIHKYENKIITFIANMLKTYHLENSAEDICQETFYKAYRSLNSFRDKEATFSTWLYTIAKNTTLSEIRKIKYTEVPLEDNDLNIHFSTLFLPEQELLRNERANRVRTAINNLPDKQRYALILREYDQMDYKEIAEALDSSVSSVKSLLFRARSGLKCQLESYVMENKIYDVELKG